MQVPLIAPAATRVALRPGAVVWLVRHGETEWNAQLRLQGQQDSSLTERGRRQAVAIAGLLARTLPRDGTPIRLVSSPLGRTLATAAPIAAALGVEATTDPRLAEIGLGAWEGMTWAEIAAGFPGALDGALHHERYFRAPGGESHGAMAERLGAWLGEAEGITVAVSHGMAGRVLRGLHGGLDPVEALALPTPQDGVWRLDAGPVEYVTAG